MSDVVGIRVGGIVDPEEGLVRVRLCVGTQDGQTMYLPPEGALKLGSMLQKWAEFAARTNHHILLGDEIGQLALMDQEGRA